MCWPRTRNRQGIRRIGDLGTTTVADASLWRALGIDDQYRGVGRLRLSQGLDEYKGCINWGFRRYNASEWMALTAEAPVCLWASRIIVDDNRGVNWGSRKYNASEWTSPTVEMPVCLQADGIDDDYGGVGRVRRAKVCSNDNGGVSRGRGIRNASEGSETTTEVAVVRRQAQGIYN